MIVLFFFTKYGVREFSDASFLFESKEGIISRVERYTQSPFSHASYFIPIPPVLQQVVRTKEKKGGLSEKFVDENKNENFIFVHIFLLRQLNYLHREFILFFKKRRRFNV